MLAAEADAPPCDDVILKLTLLTPVPPLSRESTVRSGTSSAPAAPFAPSPSPSAAADAPLQLPKCPRDPVVLLMVIAAPRWKECDVFFDTAMSTPCKFLRLLYAERARRTSPCTARIFSPPFSTPFAVPFRIASLARLRDAGRPLVPPAAYSLAHAAAPPREVPSQATSSRPLRTSRCHYSAGCASPSTRMSFSRKASYFRSLLSILLQPAPVPLRVHERVAQSVRIRNRLGLTTYLLCY